MADHAWQANWLHESSQPLYFSLMQNTWYASEISRTRCSPRTTVTTAAQPNHSSPGSNSCCSLLKVSRTRKSAVHLFAVSRSLERASLAVRRMTTSQLDPQHQPVEKFGLVLLGPMRGRSPSVRSTSWAGNASQLFALFCPKPALPDTEPIPDPDTDSIPDPDPDPVADANSAKYLQLSLPDGPGSHIQHNPTNAKRTQKNNFVDQSHRQVVQIFSTLLILPHCCA